MRKRLRSVAHTIEQLSEYGIDSSNRLPMDYAFEMEDPALDTDQVPWENGFFSSHLVDVAATFDEIFREEKSLEGLMERLREIGARHSEDPLEQEGIQAAMDLVERMEQQSPLALRVVHQLMTLGAGRQATIETCMEREKKAQLKLMARPDFQNWAKHVRKFGEESNAPPFTGWKHEKVSTVSAEEIDEIIS